MYWCGRCSGHIINSIRILFVKSLVAVEKKPHMDFALAVQQDSSNRLI